MTSPAEYFKVIETGADVPVDHPRERISVCCGSTRIPGFAWTLAADGQPLAVDADQSNGDGVTVLSRMAAETDDLTEYIGGDVEQRHSLRAYPVAVAFMAPRN